MQATYNIAALQKLSTHVSLLKLSNSSVTSSRLQDALFLSVTRSVAPTCYSASKTHSMTFANQWQNALAPINMERKLILRIFARAFVLPFMR